MKVKAQCFGADGDPLFGDSTYMDDSVGSTATFTLRLGRWSSHSSSDVAGIRIALEDPMFSEPWWNFSERNRDALPPLLRNSSWTHEENRAAKSVEDLLCNALGRDAFRSNFYSVIPPGHTGSWIGCFANGEYACVDFMLVGVLPLTTAEIGILRSLGAESEDGWKEMASTVLKVDVQDPKPAWRCCAAVSVLSTTRAYLRRYEADGGQLNVAGEWTVEDMGY